MQVLQALRGTPPVLNNRFSHNHIQLYADSTTFSAGLLTTARRCWHRTSPAAILLLRDVLV